MKWNACLFALLFLVAATQVASAGRPPIVPDANSWHIEVVGFHGGSAPPDLALDSGGLPYVLYCPPGGVRFATRTATAWVDEHVVFTPFGGICGELALGPRDVPHITTPWATAYGGETYGTRSGGVWDLAVYPGGLLDAVNARGEPQVVTYSTLGGGLSAFRYLTLRNGAWTHEDVEVFSGRVFGAAWASLVLDALQEPHVLYYDAVREDVRYAFRDATGWHVEVVDHIGALSIVGREGSLALDSVESARAAYTVRTGPKTAEVRYAVRGPTGWSSEAVSAPAPALGGGGFAPSLALLSDDPLVTFVYVEQIDPTRIVFSQDLRLVTKTSSGWAEEVILDGFWEEPIPRGQVPQFPTMAVDQCGNLHVAFYLSWWEGLDGSRSGVYYATEGEPCGGRSATLDLDPDTLNLRSRGRYVTAYVTSPDAPIDEIEPTGLALNGIPAVWIRTLDDTLVVKFDRRLFAATLDIGENVVTLTGHWTDGSPFAVTDTVRVIKPGR